MLVEISYIDATRHCGMGDEPPFEPFTEDRGELFRSMQREYGRCVSRVYIDPPGGGAPVPIGWVFQKRRRYSDCAETYLAETWVTLLAAPDTVTRTRHYINARTGVGVTL